MGAVAWDVGSGPAAPPGWQTGQVAGPSEVRDPADPRLADYVSLTDSSLRTSLEARHGLFVAEGEKVIRRALAAGYGLRSLLVTAGRLARLTDLADECAAPVYVVTDEVAQQLTGYRVHRGALASMARRELPPVAGVLATARRVVVLEDLVDHGNVGAIFRCAAAFGAGAVILSPRCADPLYRRAVKVSMGAVFAVLRGHGTSTSNPPSPPPARTTTSPAAVTSPPVNPAPSGPAATVQAYVAAINAHDYPQAWNLGGNHTGQPYSMFVQGYSGTAHDSLTVLSVSGNVVTAQLTATQTDGTVKTYQGTYTVSNGIITIFDIRQTG